MFDTETVGKTADATKAVAEASEKSIDLVAKVGQALAPAFEPLIGMMQDRANFWRLKQWIALKERSEELMHQRGINFATRVLPPKFALPLLENATLEEDAELRERWARLLVNAADASTPMELRTGYISALSELSAFDVRNFAALAEVSLATTGLPYLPTLDTTDLPHSSAAYATPVNSSEGRLSEAMLESLGNLFRVGCIVPGGGFDGVATFEVVTVTGFGRALYRACS